MPARKKEEQINLLPQKGFQATTSGRILAWILSTFRIIVIATEVIVMIAFLSRFWFDAQNTDLNEKIEQKQAILVAARDFELRFKDIQKRLKVYSNLTATNNESTNFLSNVTTYTPADVILTKFGVVDDKVEITAVTPNERSIQQFIVNLSSDETLKDVGLSKINTSSLNSSLLLFTIEANLVSKGG